MRENWQSFLVALFMAVVLWFMVSGRGEVEAWTNMRLEMTGMPADLTVMDGMQTDIQVRVRAPKGLLRALSDGALAYPLDLSGLTPGANVLPILPGRIPLSAAYEVMEVRPPRLTLAVDKLATKEVPVEPKYSGKLAQDVIVASSQAIPSTVKVHGPESLLKDIESVEVQNTLPEDAQPGTVTLAGAVTLPDALDAEPAEVEVAYSLRLETKTLKYRRTVTVMVPQGVKANIAKKRVDLFIEMPKSTKISKKLRNKVAAELVVPVDLAPGKHDLRFRVHLPDGMWLKKASPDTLSVTIK